MSSEMGASSAQRTVVSTPSRPVSLSRDGPIVPERQVPVSEATRMDPSTILIVDDNEPNLVALQAVLEPLGWPVVAARSGEQALARAKKQDFALALVDVHMPTLSGYQTVGRLRELSSARDMPIVFMSAVRDDLDHPQRGYVLGAVDFISKPFDPAVLQGKVRAIVKLYERGRRLERQRAQELERVKDVFLGAVDHDLRSPMGVIALTARLLTAAHCTDEARVAHGHRIARAARQMGDILEDILDLTRGQLAGGIPVAMAPMDFGAVTEAVVAEQCIAHPSRAIDFQVAGDVHGEGDSPRFARAVASIVGNAIQHSTGAIHVRVAKEAGGVALVVHNDGPMPADALLRIFEPFRSGDAPAEGLGLGLYVVREMARAHGGDVSVESSGATGTTFTVKIPAAARPA